MMKLTRREWTKQMLAGAAAAVLPVNLFGKTQMINSKFKGVQIGAQSYSFRDRPVDKVVEAMAQIGLGSCELWQVNHIEPLRFPESTLPTREALRQWRLTSSVEACKNIREKFNNAGIDIYAYNYSFRDDYTDEEIAKGFEMARALGVNILTASSTLSVVDRVDREASKA